MSRVSKKTELRLADALVKTLAAVVLPGVGGTLAGELGAWLVEKKLGTADQGIQLAKEIERTIDDVTRKLLRNLVSTFPSHDIEAAAIKVVATMDSVELDLSGLVDLGLSGERLTAYYLASAPPDLEAELGEAAAAYRMLLAEICYRMAQLFLENAYVHGRILRELLERRRGEDTALFERKIEWEDDEFTWDYRFEARDLMPTLDVSGPSRATIELPLDTVFQEPAAVLDIDGSDCGWIVRGPAGSGKTYLLLCLALKALAGGLPGHLAAWGPKVPLYLDLGGDSAPVPADAMARFDGRLASRAPRGWEERLIRDGKAILLMDNVDVHAVPPRLRKIKQLVRDAMGSGCVVLVNTRSAVPAAWTAELGLREIKLREMLPIEVDRFIVGWHAAVAEECATEEERKAVRAARDGLLMAVGRCSDIRGLCAVPIFLAGLCRELLGGGLTLPDDRAALVERILRATSATDPLSPADGETVSVDDWDDLIELAHWSTQNDEEFTAAQAAAWLRTTPARIGELAHRHRLLRHCDRQRFAFVQDTVRQSLAARFHAQREFLGQLVDWAATPEKRRAVVAAAACLPKSVASELLSRLANARQLGTARAALQVMQQVDPDKRERIAGLTADLVPPRSPELAAQVVAIGEVMLDLLAQEEFVGPETAACVIALARPEDLAAVATVAATADAATRKMIIESWNDRPEKAALAEMIRHREERG
ncbi:NACHT domain-containing protein [Micromonospora sp. NPDC047644]|uniref:NACHT N-terminal Helical domain 1-containing protein n=1 Tax=Micromonospora sp. NPDC047644 TaxID=3157203 RepID=UPI0034549D7D